MRSFLLSNGPLVLWLIFFSEILLLILSLRKGRKPLHWLVFSVCLGLVIDAFIQAVGVFLGEGALLQGISQIRYLLHGILVPLLVPIAFFGFGVRTKVGKKMVMGGTVLLMLLGVMMGVLTKTEPVFHAGILRYASSKATPAFASRIDRILSIGGVLPLIVMGILHLIRHRKVFLLLSGIGMFVFSALGPATGNMDLNFLISMIGELWMVLFLWLELDEGEGESQSVLSDIDETDAH